MKQELLETKQELLEMKQELLEMAEKRKICFEYNFKEEILGKNNCNLKSRFFKHCTAKFLHETYSNMLSDKNFFMGTEK